MIIKLIRSDGKELYLNSKLIESFNSAGNFVDLRFNGMSVSVKDVTPDLLMAAINSMHLPPSLPAPRTLTLTQYIRSLFTRGSA